MTKSYATQNLAAYIFLIAGIIATLYLLFIFSNAVWNSQRKEKLYAEFYTDINRLEEENKKLSERYSFQKTDEYVDKYAKANLSKVNPGEKVIILQEAKEKDPFDFSGLTSKEIELEKLKIRPIREQWWAFFFET